MANVEHNVLTGSELHEPKGIAAASDNEVYVANGSTSGAFKQIVSTKLVVVHTASDFPTAVGGIITLVASTTYRVVGTVSVGSDRFVMSADTSIVGYNPESDILTTTNADNMITSLVDGRISGVGFTCSSGTWLSIGGVAETKRFSVTNCILFSSNNIGTIDRTLDFIFTNNDIRGATLGGLLLTGVSTTIRIQNCEMTTLVTPIIDFGTSVWDNAVVAFNIFNNPGSVFAVKLDGVANANLTTTTGTGYIIDNLILDPVEDIVAEAGSQWTFRVHT